jgi:hypothetical protein
MNTRPANVSGFDQRDVELGKTLADDIVKRRA